MMNGFLKSPPVAARAYERLFLRIDPSRGNGGEQNRGSENGACTAHELSTILVNGMLTWDSGKSEVMQLAMEGRFQKAMNVLKSMDALEDPTGEKCTSLGATLESIGDAGASIQYYEMALLQFQR